MVGNLLYPWSSKPRTGLWEVELRAKDAIGTEYAAQVITCPDSTTRQRVRLYLDQADPVADVEITSYRMPGQPSIPAGSFIVDLGATGNDARCPEPPAPCRLGAAGARSHSG